MKKMFHEGNQIHNFMSSSGSGTVNNYGSGSTTLNATDLTRSTITLCWVRLGKKHPYLTT